LARSKPVKQELREYLEAERPAAITAAVWREMLRRFAPVSESYLRDLLRPSGMPFELYATYWLCMWKPAARGIGTSHGTAVVR